MGIIREWCAFLGVEPGSEPGAKRLLQASDIHAIGYKNWLEKRPGEKPRASRRESPVRAVSTQRRKAQKKVGLEATQSNATIAKKFAALRRIYRMLIASGLGITENPFDADRVPPPAKDSGRKRPTEMIDFKLVKKIVASPNAKTPKGLRDKALLACLFGGGLRRSEAAAIRIGDVRRSPAGTIYLYLRSTKAKRDAEQALPAWAGQIVEALRSARRKEGGSDGEFLFVSYTGKGGAFPTPEPVSTSGIYKLFKHYCREAGVPSFVSPHSARATAITRLLDAGISHREVQEFSRHASVQMVEAYDKRRIGVDKNPGKILDYD